MPDFRGVKGRRWDDDEKLNFNSRDIENYRDEMALRIEGLRQKMKEDESKSQVATSTESDGGGRCDIPSVTSGPASPETRRDTTRPPSESPTDCIELGSAEKPQPSMESYHRSSRNQEDIPHVFHIDKDDDSDFEPVDTGIPSTSCRPQMATSFKDL